MRKTNEIYWQPQRENNGTMNLGHRNEEKSFLGTINCVAEMMKMASEEKPIISEEDLQKCIESNAKHLNIDSRLLVSLATEELDRTKELEKEI